MVNAAAFQTIPKSFLLHFDRFADFSCIDPQRLPFESTFLHAFPFFISRKESQNYTEKNRRTVIKRNRNIDEFPLYFWFSQYFSGFHENFLIFAIFSRKNSDFAVFSLFLRKFSSFLPNKSLFFACFLWFTCYYSQNMSNYPQNQNGFLLIEVESLYRAELMRCHLLNDISLHTRHQIIAPEK